MYCSTAWAETTVFECLVITERVLYSTQMFRNAEKQWRTVRLSWAVFGSTLMRGYVNETRKDGIMSTNFKWTAQGLVSTKQENVVFF